MTKPPNEPIGYPLPPGLLHDLRTPLHQIIGYTEMLIEQAQEVEQDGFIPDLKKVRTAGGHLLSLINDNLYSVIPPVVLSVAEEEETTEVDEPKSAPAIPRKSKQRFLLVVDDNEDNREVLTRQLERQGYSVVAAESGIQALEILQDEGCDLVLLDIMMPELDGYEVLRRLKADERLQHIPVIMISALSEFESVAKCIELGAEDYLPKPFNPVLLGARIGASLEKKYAHDREMDLFAQLEQNYARLQELERLRDDLTNMIIHDLRTPLTSVIAGMQTLELVGELNNDQRDLVAIAVSGGETLLGMINDVLDVERSEAVAMELEYSDLDVAELIASAIGQVTSLAEGKDITLLTEVMPGLPSLHGDQSKLLRTLVNLLGNGIKFTPAGGTVTVSANEDEAGICFSVIDTGEGIPPEAFDRIFEKFGQVEARQRGGTRSTGLGLTFCKLAAESHGGRIWVESVPGEGSKFCFTIPLSQRPETGPI